MERERHLVVSGPQNTNQIRDTSGVFAAAYELNSVSVMEGESVTLHTDREMRNNDLILWRFGPENTLIAEINVTDSSVTLNDHYDWRFRGRMKVDHQTGCLTITDTRPQHAGRYQLQTNRMKKFIILTVNGVSGGKEEMKSLSVMEGQIVNLHSDTEIRNKDLVLWRFENYTIVKINKTSHSITIYDDVLEGRFRDRLTVNDETGSLTITNTRTEQTGFYQMQTNRMKKDFILSVYALLPVPVIFRYCTQSPSSSSSSSVSRHVLLCSVLNVREVTLSWYKGSSLLSSISVFDLSISLSLPLELEYQDQNGYRCVLNNSLTEQTQHLDITQLSHTCSDSGCNSAEAVFRLVVTALVGVAAAAAVVLLLYDIRSRRAEQERARVPTSAT
ncbi:V-set and immunoglobulin domain-containing protein 1 [Labeo rohita]|nr:V-set and immunoglobulin domain-containing protein 1 [Labeo rohita]